MILPTKQHLAWHEKEVGVIIHLDMYTMVPTYVWDEDWENYPPASKFSPSNLDTDQWLAAATAAGATYAILVAKHGSGFSLWPTAAHPYSIASSPWKDGKGDIVGDFIASCKKYNVKPGIYYNTNANGYLGMDINRIRTLEKEKVAEYHRIVMLQLRELWSHYGELFEIWFDGGVVPVEQGGPDLVELLRELQPNALAFQGPPGSKAILRWIGNERAVAPENCSAIVDYEQEGFDGTEERTYAGNTHGNLWCPGEADTPNRDADRAFEGGWFWREGEEDTIFPAETLFEKYLTSVGRNTNLLIGMGIDWNGAFPKEDTAAFAGFGELVKQAFGKPLIESFPDIDEKRISLAIPEGKTAHYLVVQEDISFGEQILDFSVLHGESEIIRAQTIGHKRILPLKQLPGGSITFVVNAVKEKAHLRCISLF